MVKKKRVVIGDGGTDGPVVVDPGGGGTDPIPTPDPVTPTSTTLRNTLLGPHYKSNSDSDDLMKEHFGRYGDIANSYYSEGSQFTENAKNVEIARIKKGISTNISVQTAGSNKIELLGQNDSATVTWLDTWLVRAEAAALTNPNVPVFITLDHEWEVGVNKGDYTSVSATETGYAAAFDKFIQRARVKAPHCIVNYWVGGYDKTAILATMTAMTLFPQVISCDPYVFEGEAANQTLTQCMSGYLDWFKTGAGSTQYKRLGSPPFGISETGKDLRHGDQNCANFYTNMRTVMVNQNVWFCVFFNKVMARPFNISGDYVNDTSVPANFRYAAQPLSMAAFTDSLADKAFPDPTQQIISNTTTVTSLGDPDATGVIREISGIALSKRNGSSTNRIFYGHNDQNYTGETGAHIYVFDASASTDILADITLTGVDNASQFEDIAVGPGPDATKSYVYVGRIGSGASQKQFLRFEEPAIAAGSNNLQISVTPTIFNFSMPTGVSNSEAFFVDWLSGDLFWFEKRTVAPATPPTRPFTSRAYKITDIASKPNSTTATTVSTSLAATIMANEKSTNDSGFTAATISRNGKYIVLCNYQEIFIWNRLDTNVTITEMFTDRPKAPVRTWMTSDAGSTTTWGGESLEVSEEAKPTRIYGITEGALASLKYATTAYGGV